MTTLGDMLIEARKKSGLSAHDMAQRTHIMLAAIYSLEDDNHSALPAAGYVRGYILSYCKVCDVDPTPFLEQYEVQSGNSRRDAISRPSYSYATNAAPRKIEHEMNWRVVAIAAVVIVVIAGAILLLTRDNDGPSLNPLPAGVETTVTANPSEYVPEEQRIPFSFTIEAREGHASDVRVVIDGNVAFDGALIDGSEEAFDGVLEAEIQIARPENVIITQGEDNVVIPDDGELTLIAFEE
ncbi:MAG: helix-turn-helix domain-containing protein [Coriobacteriia bacterium]|nr:helix-turn-helix domain-containing protein [Coriobacteriia bacterium]MCL2745963.1 helix-turn-helix domain-containing protein [Coriobacteriia bacterium]MCL2870064.1 helix-turn-helix domain-containing protein [Coriobacteriia bacterium]